MNNNKALFCECPIKNKPKETKDDTEDEEEYSVDELCESKSISNESECSYDRLSIASTLSGDTFWNQYDFGGQLTSCDCHRSVPNISKQKMQNILQTECQKVLQSKPLTVSNQQVDDKLNQAEFNNNDEHDNVEEGDEETGGEFKSSHDQKSKNLKKKNKKK